MHVLISLQQIKKMELTIMDIIIIIIIIIIIMELINLSSMGL